MNTENDPWDELGSLDEDEPIHVLTKLYAMYDNDLTTGKADNGTRLFFQRLHQAIEQSKECNLNRR